MTPLQITSGTEFSTRLDGWRRSADFARIDDDPIYGDFGRIYYPAVFEERRNDVSFAVTDGHRPLLIVQCSRGDDEVDYYGAPVRLVPREGLAGGEGERAVRAAFAQLDAVAGEGRSRRITVRDDASLGTLSAVGKLCLNRRSAAALRLTGICALDQGET